MIPYVHAGQTRTIGFHWQSRFFCERSCTVYHNGGFCEHTSSSSAQDIINRASPSNNFISSRVVSNSRVESTSSDDVEMNDCVTMMRIYIDWLYHRLERRNCTNSCPSAHGSIGDTYDELPLIHVNNSLYFRKPSVTDSQAQLVLKIGEWCRMRCTPHPIHASVGRIP